MKVNKKAVWDWFKRTGGYILTVIVAPAVTAKYGPVAGGVVGAIGGVGVHQARRFGDGKTIKGLQNDRSK